MHRSRIGPSVRGRRSHTPCLTACLFAGAALLGGCVNRGEVLDDAGGIRSDAPPDAPACAPLGCNAVDLLFVVDNSLSMAGAQAQLRAAFPEFLAQIRTQLTDASLHLMVVDSDAGGIDTTCNRLCVDPEYVVGPNEFCAGFPCASLAERGTCDYVLGAGVTYPVGAAASNVPCDFPEGRRYLETGDANLEELLLCSAGVGIMGQGDERPIGAMFNALGAESATDGCNEGFLREEALLVVVIISDAGASATELDTESVQAWHDRLMALKCGREEGVVFIAVTHDGEQAPPFYSSLRWEYPEGETPEAYAVQWHDYCTLAPRDTCCCPRTDGAGGSTVCSDCADEPPPWERCWFAFTGYGTPLVRLAESFGDNGLVREICSDFGDVLNDTLTTVRDACEVF